jgi:hypothetical protein
LIKPHIKPFNSPFYLPQAFAYDPVSGPKTADFWSQAGQEHEKSAIFGALYAPGVKLSAANFNLKHAGGPFEQQKMPFEL